MEKMSLPPEVVVSIASVDDLNPTPQVASSFTVCTGGGVSDRVGESPDDEGVSLRSRMHGVQGF